jgi:hypothetical protein
MMCDMCNGMSWRQVVEKAKLTIARHGWQLQFVEGSLTSPAFGYTVGLTELRHPELILTGRRQPETVELLNDLAAQVFAGGQALTAGMRIPLQARDVYLVPLEDPREVLRLAGSVYGRRLRALQAVWADDSGRLPWEQAVPDVLTQPLYGTPPGIGP